MNKIIKYAFSLILLFANLSNGQTTSKISGYILNDYDGKGNQNVDVTLDNGGGNVTTNAEGYYEILVPSGWSGTATPSKVDYTFYPSTRSYANVITDDTNENYQASSVNVYFDGTIIDDSGQPMAGVEIVFSNGGGSTFTDANGYYYIFQGTGWSGTATPTYADYTFSPEERMFTLVSGYYTGYSYTGSSIYVFIDGYVYNSDNNNESMPGVDVVFSNSAGTVTTDANGYYKKQILKGWSGTLKPIKTDFVFNPETYTNVTYNRNKNFYGNSIFAIIDGYVYNSDNNNESMPGVDVVFSNSAGTVTTNANGYYKKQILKGWSGTITPVKTNFVFSPRELTNVTSSRTSYNFYGNSIFAFIDGYVKRGNDNQGISGVNIEFSNGGGTTTTNEDGYYYKFINKGWSGTATPSKDNFTFSPKIKTYNQLNSNRTNNNYSGYSIYAFIDGYVLDIAGQGVEGVEIEYSNGGGTTTTNEDGYYYKFINKGWSGTAIPSKLNHNFDPEYRSYSNISYDEKGDNFEATNPNSNYETHVIIAGSIYDENYYGIAGVEISFGDDYNSVTTDKYGYYESGYIRKGWIGSVTPSKEGHLFSPESYDFNPIEYYEWDKDFMATSNYVFIGGWVRDTNNNGISDVEILFNNNGGVVKTDDVGYYSNFVLKGTNYTATPTKEGFEFLPSSRTHTGVNSESEQNYNASISNSILSILDNTSLRPSQFTVLSAYPNPFNPSTTITYGLDRESNVNISIYDITGQLITTLQNENQTLGWHSTVWNGTDNNNNQVPAGIYFGKITSNNTTKTTKLMLLK